LNDFPGLQEGVMLATHSDTIVNVLGIRLSLLLQCAVMATLLQLLLVLVLLAGKHQRPGGAWHCPTRGADLGRGHCS